jgi:hypothetical protein
MLSRRFTGVLRSTGERVVGSQFSFDQYNSFGCRLPPDFVEPFPELLLGLYLGHPAICGARGWNFSSDPTNPTFIVLVPKMALPPLRVRHLFSPTEKSIIIYGIARALAWIHSRHLVCRCLSPDNIAVDGSSRPFLKLSGRIDVNYLPPGDRDFFDTNPASDVYSLGLVIWSVVANREWHARDVSDYVDGLHVSQPDVYRVRGMGQDRLWGVVQQMCSKDPEARPTSREVMDMLGQPDLWLPGTDAKEFARYVRYVDNNELKGEAELPSHILWLLQHRSQWQRGTVPVLLDRANMVAVMGFMTGLMASEPNDTVCQVVEEALRRDSSFVRSAVYDGPDIPWNPGIGTFVTQS